MTVIFSKEKLVYSRSYFKKKKEKRKKPCLAANPEKPKKRSKTVHNTKKNDLVQDQNAIID